MYIQKDEKGNQRHYLEGANVERATSTVLLIARGCVIAIMYRRSHARRIKNRYRLRARSRSIYKNFARDENDFETIHVVACD